MPLSPAKRRDLTQHLERSVEELLRRNASYFHDLLPPDSHWRLFGEFRHEVAYLDIETTGLDGPGDYVTTIAIYDGQTIRYYVRGRNLDTFAQDIDNYRLIVTYNGAAFDLPFIRSRLGLSMQHAHIDLRQVLAGLDYAGGLKACEREFNLERGNLSDIDGFFAMGLWLDYLRGNERALNTLLVYNILDAVHLESLMIKAYNLKLEETPFVTTNHMSETDRPVELPFEPDKITIERLRRRYS